MMKYRKPYRIKKKKSLLKNRFFWLLFLALIIFGGIFYLIYFSVFFQVKNINISGQEKVSVEEVKKIIEEKIKKSIFFFQTRSIFLVNFNEINEVLLKNFLQIDKINLKRKFPDTLEIKIEERKPVALFVLGDKENENYFFIDKKGIIFASFGSDISKGVKLAQQMLKIKNLNTSASSNGGVQLGEKVIKENILSQILDIETVMVQDLKIPLEEITIISDERLNVKTLEGWETYFNPKEDLNWQITKLKIVLENKIPLEKRPNLKYIDLRFEKVYIFPEGLFNPPPF